MKNFLYITDGISDDPGFLGQVLALAGDYQTTLAALLVCPAIPASLAGYRDLIRESIAGKFNASLAAARQAAGDSQVPESVSLDSQEGDLHAVRIIRRVLRDSHGLVIKAVETPDHVGLRSLDMELLRKCPCPVWLHRPGSSLRNTRQMAVAIDPESVSPEARALSLRMLRLSREIATSHGARLHLVSCWDFPLEDYLRNSLRVDIDGNELTKVVLQARDTHYDALQALCAEAGADGDMEIHHLRGAAADRIPRFITEMKIELLVMGTLARTGIPGFVIGNTAENIARSLSCSLLALKPEGFISPVPKND